MRSRLRARAPARVLARPVLALALLGSALAVLLGWMIAQTAPRPMAGVAAADGVRTLLPCVSYAPFRRPGHTPLDPDMRVRPDQIEADLRQLATITGCVRTYGVSQGLEAVPGIARRLGLRVLLGAWIDRDPAHDERELGTAIALAREHADVIDLLLVGNEVLLRGDRTPAELVALLARARREQPVPVAYPDVWAYWLRHAQALHGHVDVAAVHVLPYWDDEPVALEGAVAHVRERLGAMREALAPLPVFIAETGWPAAGRQRGPAAPGTIEQTRFVREMLAVTDPWDWKPGWNLIEGYDQPWKRRFEGAMGGYWGVYTAAGERRVSFDGPVVADPSLVRDLIIAAAGALAGLLAALRWRLARLPLALSGALIAALASLQAQSLALWSLDVGQMALGALIALPPAACALAAALRLANPNGARARGPGPWLPSLHATVIVCALLLLGQLIVDGRYRPLLWPIYAAPAVLLPVLWLADGLPRMRAGAAAGLTLLAAATILLWREGIDNTQALLAVLACAGIAGPAIAAARRPRDAQRVAGREAADGPG